MLPMLLSLYDYVYFYNRAEDKSILEREISAINQPKNVQKIQDLLAQSVEICLFLVDINGGELTIPSRLPAKCLLEEQNRECRQKILHLLGTVTSHEQVALERCCGCLYVFVCKTGFVINGKAAYLAGGMIEDCVKLEKSLELIKRVYALPVEVTTAGGQKQSQNILNGKSDGLLRLLTQQEMKTLRLIGDGFSNKDIAAKLFISINTVKAHVSRLLQKLSLNNRTDAALFALKKGLVKGDEDIDA
jgi:DNA-binding CsgD family transcriptional regulator